MSRIFGYTISKFLLFIVIGFLVLFTPSVAEASECPQSISPTYYPLLGTPAFESGGFIKIQTNKDFSVTVKAEDILEGELSENLTNGAFSFRIKPKAHITMSYKNLTHDFSMSEDERPFYIDTAKMKIIYLSSGSDGQNTSSNELSPDCEYRCNKTVKLVDCNCCRGGYVGECYGWVSCGAGWKDDKCMKDVNGKIFCQNNC